MFSEKLKQMSEKEIKELFSHCIDKLSPKEQQVIDMYYYQKKTLECIGNELGISRQRVHQIKEKALRRLRHIIYTEVKYENI